MFQTDTLPNAPIVMKMFLVLRYLRRENKMDLDQLILKLELQLGIIPDTISETKKG